MAVDLVIDVDNKPGRARRGRSGDQRRRREHRGGHVYRPGRPSRAAHPREARRAGAARARRISHIAVSREREVVVVDVEDRPGVLADLTRKVARAGVDLDLVYIATRNRVVFGAPDIEALRAALA